MDRREIEQFILRHLKEFNKTNVDIIRNSIQKQINDNELANKQRQGNVTVRQVFGETKKLPAEQGMLVNEIIYDLIVERVITPGTGTMSTIGDGYSLPDISVTNIAKLNEKLSGIK
ncbi:MAG TPA: hypothetical protein DEF35_08900 [Paenibacillus sp.]|uniref:hypothetical protein n=1 Tax=Paenibacillus TaxID=44249 RepID=UPI000B9FCF88|nr:MULTISPECIES: hypothetical protein [Paenibacillus]OZQ64351.1 hypothetical protein CA599_22570 [Paenibacillus taichungensis]HBU81743.1 hypothetical protein [Paenibacillus sp.]